jgi:hypothetical protein
VFSKLYLALACFITVLLHACSSDKTSSADDAMFQLLPSSQTGITFINKVEDKGEFNVFKYRNFYNGGGVAIGDINNDGLPDIFFTANQTENKLYLNEGNFKFKDITETAGVKGFHKWHTGVTMADVNGDGWLDIYVSSSGEIPGDDRANELYINQKNSTFKEEAHAYGLDDKGLSTQAAFFDYDHDGDLDCFVLNNSFKPIAYFGYNRNLRNIRDSANGDRLYKNNNGHFIDVSAKAGIFGSEIGFGLGITVNDINNDGWDDMYISNDFFEKDYLYINQKNGIFKEVIDSAINHISQASMGSDIADINNDGNFDIFTTDMVAEDDRRLKTTTRFDDYDVLNAKLKNDFHHQFSSNCLQLNNGDGTFSEIAQLAGIDATDWSWGALSFDFDNDGWKDFFVSNGIWKDLTDQDFLAYFGSDEVMSQAKAGTMNFNEMLDKMPSVPILNFAFLNEKNLAFKNISKAAGFDKPGFSNGAAYGDLDGDGDLDLVINNENMEAFVYKNTTSEKHKAHYLKIKLTGNAPNTFGVGARVTIYTKGIKQTAQQIPARGFQSSVEPVLNFGTGQMVTIDSLIIWWPDMITQTLYNIKTDTTLMLYQNQANEPLIIKDIPKNTWYKNIASSIIKGDSLHKENAFIDFNEQRLIPKMISAEGPKLDVADVNGDGLADFFMGSAKNDTAKLFIQQPGGQFVRKRQYVFEQSKDMEDVGAEFFDADNDGDMDLVIASGGNEERQGSLNLLTRLYINDGKGNFTNAAGGWPFISINASCVRTGDYDNDGDSDIFIGSRCIPGAYGIIPASILLRNDGKGKFTNVTASVAPSLQKLGMVTDAHWVDVDNDGKKELIVVGDYMPVTILKFINNQLIVQEQIAKSAGWWNCLTVADINNDGYLDFIAGNRGVNSKWKADAAHPSLMYTSDFDNNGQSENICTYYKTDGKSYPYILLGELLSQLPSLKARFPTFSSYGGKQVEDIFTKAQLGAATKLEVVQEQSCIFLNNGKGHFTMQPLPLMAQIAPVFAITVTDFNNDGFKDIFLGGNFYGLKPELGRWDASFGCTLLGNADHTFTYMKPAETGLFVRGEVRDIQQIKTPFGNDILVARNNDAVQVFTKTK